MPRAPRPDAYDARMELLTASTSRTATMAASAPSPVAPAPRGFVAELQSASKSIGWAGFMIGSDWYGPGDTGVAMYATSNALAAVDRALLATVTPGGHLPPTAALDAARDGKAFLTRAYEIMDVEHFAPPVEARAFLTAAQRSLDAAINEYRARLEPTPRDR